MQSLICHCEASQKPWQSQGTASRDAVTLILTSHRSLFNRKTSRRREILQRKKTVEKVQILPSFAVREKMFLYFGFCSLKLWQFDAIIIS